MTEINRRGFLALGATGMFAPAFAAISDPLNPIERRKRIKVKESLEDNLINEYLQPKQIALKVGAAKPFTALHFSDTHVSMMDAADILSGKAKELSLYEARNHGLFGRGGFPFGQAEEHPDAQHGRPFRLPQRGEHRLHREFVQGRGCVLVPRQP